MDSDGNKLVNLLILGKKKPSSLFKIVLYVTINSQEN